MGRSIPEELIDQVRSGTDIVDLVAEYVVLKKTGKNYTGLCPFHGEKTPSFTVSQDKQIFYCFGCGAGGNVFSFVSRMEGLSFPEAVEKLAARAGIRWRPQDLSPAQEQKLTLRKNLTAINHLARDYFRRMLATPEGEAARKYLAKRGVNPETEARFELGFAPSRWDGLLQFMGQKGVPPGELLQLGLVKTRKGGGYYDTFRNRLMFPIHDRLGRVVSFGGRALSEEEGPKYLNGPETAVFAKRINLYGLYQARESIRRQDQVVVVEGYMDAIALAQYGVENVVASLGTSFTEEQGRLLRRATSNVVIAFDADAAGQAAALRGLDILSRVGCRVRVAPLPQGMDPDDFVRRQGAKAFSELTGAKSLSLIEYRLALAVQQNDLSSIEGRLKVLRNVLPEVAAIPGAMERQHYVELLSNQLSTSPEAVYSEMRLIMDKRQKPEGVPDKKAKFSNNTVRESRSERLSATIKAERSLAVLALAQPSVRSLMLSHLSVEDFHDPAAKSIIENLIQEDQPASFPEMIDRLGHEGAKGLAAQAAAITDEYDAKVVEDLISMVRRGNIQRRLTALQQDISKAEEEGDWAGVVAKLQERMALEGKLKQM